MKRPSAKVTKGGRCGVKADRVEPQVKRKLSTRAKFCESCGQVRLDGPRHKFTKSNFLTAEFHWHSILKLIGADPTQYTVVVLNDSRKPGACHGHGPTQIVIENLGNQHFQPFLLSA